MSVYPKFLWPIIIPTGGWDFDADSLVAPATIPPGIYTSILHVLDELETQCEADASGDDWEWEVDSLGTVTGWNDGGAWTVTWGSTTDGLSSVMGFDESEAVDGSDILTSSSQHLNGYYPGLISYGYASNRGVGTTNTKYWAPEWSQVRTVAGNHATRVVGPATARSTMALSFGLIRDIEASDASRGLRAFVDGCAAFTFYLYPDRSYGTVDAPGTQDAKTFDSGNLPYDDYWCCAFTEGGDPVFRQGGGSAGFGTWEMIVNREP